MEPQEIVLKFLVPKKNQPAQCKEANIEAKKGFHKKGHLPEYDLEGSCIPAY